MAKLYGLNNAVDFAAKNLINFTSIFARSAGQPLDKTAIWYPAHVDAEWNVVAADAEGAVYKTGYERAAQYAATSAAYVGQELAVIDVTYDEDGTTVASSTVKFYGIQDAAGTLKELGAIPVGDESTITVDEDGKISLKGVDTLTFERDVVGDDGEPTGTKEEVKYQALLTKDGLTWVEPSKTTVEGLATLIEALESKATQLESKVGANTSAITAEAQAREAADEALTEAITDLAKNISDTIGEVDDDTTVVGMIGAALEAAKKYADDNDSDTIYDDTAVKARIKAIEDDYLKTADKYDDTKVKADISGHETRLGAIETAIGDESKGLTKALNDEIAARTQGDADTLAAAKAYTDNISVAIETKEDDEYIVIKNVNGTEIAAVDATKFVKDGMLESAVYSTSTKKLVLTWNTDAGKSATEIDLNDLVNTYTGSDHIIVSTDGKISVADDVALESDLTALETAFEKAIEDEAKARDDADKAIGERIDGVVADVALKAVKTDVETALAAKADKSAFDTHVEAYGKFVESYTTDKSTFATKTDLDNKVDATTYANDKTTFATKTDVNGQFTAVGQRIGLIEEAVGKEAEGETAATGLYKKIEDLGTDVVTNYATKTEVAGVDAKAVSNTNLITNLTDRLDGIVAQGGEPNTINTIKVNGVAQAITDKSVDIAVPVISDVKIADLNDGTALVNRVAATESDIKAINTAVSGNQTGIVSLTKRIGALETEVKIEGESRIDALETAVNGVEGVSDGLVGKVATHTTEIAGLKTKDNELASLIQGNTDKFADYYTKTAVDGLLKTVDLSSRLETSVFESYKTSQAELIATLATKSEVEAVSTEVAKKANAADVYDKTTADSTFVKDADFNDKVDARVNTLIDGANSEDTIKNVTNLVAFVNENAGDIAQLITDVEANTSAIAANKAAHEKNAADIATLITAVNAQKVVESTEISTTPVESGMQLGIKEVNVNKLVQTEGDVLILNGGSANI